MSDTFVLKSGEIERLNNLLYPLFPVLKDRMEAQFGEALDTWLDKPETKSAVFIRSSTRKDEAPFDFAVDEIDEYTAAYYALDMDGWDGITFAEMLSPDDKKELQEVIHKFIVSRSPSFALKKLIEAIDDDLPDENRDHIIFFVYGALQETGLPEELSYLWILRSNQSPVFDDSFRYDYMFLLEDGCGFNGCWELCRDVLPPELLPAFNAEWIDEED